MSQRTNGVKEIRAITCMNLFQSYACLSHLDDPSPRMIDLDAFVSGGVLSSLDNKLSMES
jgi:hypothetical protein